MDEDEHFNLALKPDDVDLENRASVFHLAQQLVESKRIKFDIDIRKFIVTSSSGRAFLVAMHPWRCSCPGTTTCSHLIAAHMVTGYTDKRTKKPPNTALAATKARKAADKIGGKKKPRPKDLDKKPKKVIVIPVGIEESAAVLEECSGRSPVSSPPLSSQTDAMIEECFGRSPVSSPPLSSQTYDFKTAALHSPKEDFSSQSKEENSMDLFDEIRSPSLSFSPPMAVPKVKTTFPSRKLTRLFIIYFLLDLKRSETGKTDFISGCN